MTIKRIGQISSAKWKQWGFVKTEREQLSHITWDGLAGHAYLWAIIRHRISLHANAKKYHWSNIKYYNALKRDYKKKIGDSRINIDNFWKYFYFYKDDPEYAVVETPRPARKGQPKGKEHRKPKVTPLEQAVAKIEDTKKKLARAEKRGDQKEHRRLEKDLSFYTFEEKRLRGKT